MHDEHQHVPKGNLVKYYSLAR